ncbi:hypothetical protein VIAG107301_13465 [Vibrio agarivorans]
MGFDAERADLINGKLQLHLQKNKGTTIELQVTISYFESYMACKSFNSILSNAALSSRLFRNWSRPSWINESTTS